jgi:magnesium-transporting ATPase (P-type)
MIKDDKIICILNETVDKGFLQSRKHFFLGCFLNAHAKVNPPDAEHLLWYALGDPTEAALIVLAKKM